VASFAPRLLERVPPSPQVRCLDGPLSRSGWNMFLWMVNMFFKHMNFFQSYSTRAEVKLCEAILPLSPLYGMVRNPFTFPADSRYQMSSGHNKNKVREHRVTTAAHNCLLRSPYAIRSYTVRPPLWSSGQSSWLQIRRPGFDSTHYQKKK
jgi:hypothetical protein